MSKLPFIDDTTKKADELRFAERRLFEERFGLKLEA